jgi:hypothetical protein
MSTASFADHLAFLVLIEGVVGQQLGLHVVMRDDLPAALERRVDHGAALQSHLGVHRAGGRHAEFVEDVEHAPDAYALTVFAPGVIRIVVDVAGQVAADDAGSARIERLRCVLGGVPVFEIGGDHHGEPLPVGPAQRLALGNRHEVVFHWVSILCDGCSKNIVYPAGWHFKTSLPI